MLIIWLAFSNQILILISGSVVPKKCVWDTNLYKDYVYCSLSTLENMNNLTEEWGFSGWAFVKTSIDNSSRYVSFILKG